MIVGALALLAAPAAAQPVAPAAAVVPPAIAAAAAPDPARLAVARRLVDKVVPSGTLQRVMQTSLGAVTGSMLSSFLPPDMQAEARRKDPAFDERLRRITAVMGREVGALMSEMEPQMRAAVAAAYARRFDAKELADISAFFDTPSGAAYASQSLTLMTDPDLMQLNMSMLPKIVQRMPAIAAKIQAATADLPPIPKPSSK